MSRSLADLIQLARLIQQRFLADRCAQVAASLTLTTLLALVPIFTIAVTVFSAFPVFGEMMAQVKIFLLTNMVPNSAGKIIAVYMTQFSEKAARLTAIGIALLTVTALMLMLTINQAFNVIWRVRRPRPLLQRFLIYWAVLTLGPLLVGASLSLTSYLVSLSLGWVGESPVLRMVPLNLTPVLLTIAALTLLYLAVPNRTVKAVHALAAGAVAGVAFELMKKLFALYLTTFPTYTLVYGAFAILPIFLVWVYLSWLTILFGAVMAAALPYWHRSIRGHENTPAFQFAQALIALRVLYQAWLGGAALPLAEIQAHLQVGLDESEDILMRLEKAHWVSRTASHAWLLSCDPDALSVAEIFREFVFRADVPPDLPADLQAPLQPWLDGLRAALEGVANPSLRKLCETPEKSAV
ncbi:MAG: YihY family inner membrane protein [Sulfuricella sp.]|nr:YihY family inner membrane protein [Sulfuricella sp.]